MKQKTVCPTVEPGSHLMLRDLDWNTYSHFRKLFEESRFVRLTYDRGSLEIRRPSLSREDFSGMLVYLVRTFCEEWGLPLKPGGAATMYRKSQSAAIEADEIFWVANAARMARRRNLDLRRDPPPDLAVDVELP